MEPTPEDVVQAIKMASATSAQYATGGTLVQQVTRHCRATDRLEATLQAAFSEDELYRLLLALVDIHRDVLRDFDTPETLDDFLSYASPDGI